MKNVVANSFRFIIILSFILIGTQTQSFAQANEYVTDAEEMPQPIGGLEAIMKNVVYPKEAKVNNIQGKVLVEAFIDASGNVVEVKIKEGVEALNNAAQTAVKKTKFTPAKVKGKAVKSKIIIPIMFKLS
ncbi:MAG: energy transducer TonB [Melioribacteraceae bacterium]|nr:MAG: energy transducer TonB [Melioribacteraceae bacterium]